EHVAITNRTPVLRRYCLHAGNVVHRLRVRQSFSVRLAQAASRARKSQGIDPSDRLSAPPDWWAPDAVSEFYAEAAQVCRFLDLADPSGIRPDRLPEVRPPTLQQILDFSHMEKITSYRTVVNLLKMQRRPPALSLN